MNCCTKIYEDDVELIAVDNQDYVEDKLIEICEEMTSGGVHLLEITSALIFVTHYMLCKDESSNTEKYYRYLLKQCQVQIEALHELNEFPMEQKKQP